MPYQPFAEALDWYTGHVDQPVLGRHPGELIRLQPLLGSRLAGLAAPVSSDPRSEEFLLFEATRAWLVELSRQQPVVLVLETCTGRPNRCCCCCGSAAGGGGRRGGRASAGAGHLPRHRAWPHHALAGVMADVRRLPGVEQLAMAGLSAVEVAELLSQAAGHDLDDDGRRLAESLHAETEGNPFFVGEVLRHLAETGMVRRQDDRWVVARWLGGGARRSARRGRAASRTPVGATNQMLSVRPCSAVTSTSSSWPRCGTSPRTACSTPWMRRCGRDLSRRPVRTATASPTCWTCTLVEELSATRRRRLHRRVGEALEKLRPDDVAALAHHFTQAGPDGEGMPERCATAWPPPNRPSRLAPWATRRSLPPGPGAAGRSRRPRGSSTRRGVVRPG